MFQQGGLGVDRRVAHDKGPGLDLDAALRPREQELLLDPSRALEADRGLLVVDHDERLALLVEAGLGLVCFCCLGFVFIFRT